MLFINTKNPTIIRDFKQAIIKPVLGNDGGIFVPSFIPKLGQQEIEKICDKTYKDILVDIIDLYWKECEDINIIQQLVDNAFSGFNKTFQDDNEKQKQHRYFDGFISIDKFDHKQKVINLTYGPTGNVKDYGNFLTAEFINYFAQQDNINFTIIDCENSNSVVSTAYAVSEKTNLKSFLIFNDINQNGIGLLSLLKKKNLEFISINEDISFFKKIKQDILNNKSFQEIKNLSFINSLNILNILAYIPIFFKLYNNCTFKPFCVSIPTNNMGLAISAFFAKKMGIPINKIIMCIEKNTFLLKFQDEKIVNNNTIIDGGFSCLSSSIPSNFERLLFYLYSSDQMSVKRSLEELKKCNIYKVNDSFIRLFLDYFYVVQTNNLFTIQNCIYSFQKENNIIVDLYFAMSKIGYNNAILNIGNEISNLPVILFNTMNYKRNIKFINDTLGYELLNTAQSFTQENINTFQPTKIENNEESLLKYIINFDF